MRAGVIGAGNIGMEVYRQLVERGHEVSFVARSSGVYDSLRGRKIGELGELENFLKDVQIVFLAIPTLDDGATGYNYIVRALNAGVPVATCEKGALVNYFPELEPRLNRIGYSATVGGFELKVDGWFISGGFRRVEDFESWQLPHDVNNLILIKSDTGYCWRIGEGAGAKATVDATMCDAERLVK